MLSDLQETLAGLSAEQYVAGYVFFGSYALSLSSFIGRRGRRIALTLAPASVVAFAAGTDPWEQGVILAAIGLLMMGAFMVAVWGTWALLERSRWQPAVVLEREVESIKPVSAAQLRRRLADLWAWPVRHWARP